MVEMLKRSIFATIGIALMTREKAEEIARRVASEARLSESEGKLFVDELMKRADETRQTFEKTVTQYVESALKKVNLVTRSDFEALEHRVGTIESSLRQDVE